MSKDLTFVIKFDLYNKDSGIFAEAGPPEIHLRLLPGMLPGNVLMLPVSSGNASF